MAFLFRTSKVKSPGELVRLCNEQLVNLDRTDNPSSKAVEDVTKTLQTMKLVLFGDTEHEPNPEQSQLLVDELFATDFLSLLVKNLPVLSFESRKDAANIFKNVMQRQKDGQKPGMNYVLSKVDLMPLLVKGYEDPDVAMMSGSMLRECIKHDSLARHLLWSDYFYCFFNYVELPNFDVASDAFVTFREMLTRHKAICAEFLDKNYENVFDSYTKLLTSSNYVTRRQSLKLLGELLLDRKNFAIMTRYIASTDNLKLMMNMLRDKSKSIQFEAFHVFKVFVANPNKPEPIKQILLKNKAKLVSYLGTFQNDKDDDQFREEKNFLIKEIENMQ